MHTDSLLTELSGKTHDYTVEVTNRFKGIDLIDKVLEELWTEVCNIVQEVVTKTIPRKKKEMQQGKLSEEALKIARKKKKKRSERQRRKGKIYPSECRVPENSKER